MASTLLRQGLECSCSSRPSASYQGILRPLQGRKAFAQLVPALGAHSGSIQQCPRATFDLQPPAPFREPRRLARQRLRPLRVVEELTSADQSYPDDVDLEAYERDWGIPGVIEFGTGQADLPTVMLTHPQTGMQLVVYLYGATIAQWLKNDGTATFFDGPDYLYEGDMPLRTGVSLHFPQHREGLLPQQHGFADSMMWEVVGAGFDNLEFFEELGKLVDEVETYGADWEEAGKEREAWEAARDAARQQRWQERQARREQRRAAAGEGEDVPEEDEEEEGEEDAGPFVTPNINVDSDMAPFIVLRLRDTPETRAVWPHKFELDYKITLMTQDKVTEEDVGEMRLSLGLDPEEPEWYGTAEELMADEMEEADGLGQGEREGEGGGEEEEASGGEAAAEAAPKRGRRGRPPKAAAGAGDEASGSPDGGDSGDEGEEKPVVSAAAARGAVTRRAAAQEEAHAVVEEPISPAVQIKQEFWVRNKDKRGSEPLHFNLASLARFATLQQPQAADWVKVLGLGGSQTFDYTADPRSPALDMCMEDFIHFNGEPRDVTYVGAADATVYLCPGNRTHFEFIQRAGFRDMFIEQPPLTDEAAADGWDRAAAVGTGYVASTKRLFPGEEWHAESVIRFHARYWRQPIFGDDSMPPLPPIPRELLEEGNDEDEFGEDEGVSPEDVFEDLPSADAGGGGGGGPEGEE